MAPFLAFVLFALFGAAISDDEGSFCAKNKCSCEYVTHKRTHLPVLIADCSGSELNTFPDRTQISQDVQSLDLSFNNVDELFEADFSSTSLETLSLCHNKIRYISEKFFSRTPNLKRLDLSHNVISSFEGNIFNGLRFLQFLDVSFNSVDIVPPVGLLEPLKNLSVLNVSYSALGKHLMESPSLINSTLGVSSGLTHLEANGLDVGSLKNGFFDGVEVFKRLSLADNPLPETPVLPDTVEFLDLSGTQITKLVAGRMNYHNLKELRLNRLRKLTMVDKYAFYNLVSLESLSMDDCPRLRELNDTAFGIITRDIYVPLKRLSISRSGLQRLNSSYSIIFNKLEYINLEYNQWRCDCNLMWLREFNRTLRNPELIRCSLPLRLRDKQFMLMDEAKLMTCNVDRRTRISSILLPVLGVLVVVLFVLIVYLIYLGPFYRDRFAVGPRSPYQGVTTVSAET